MARLYIISAMVVQLTSEEQSRYSRHLLLPEVGIAGQRKLKSARILVAGCGGLGAPVSAYLAAAGVGTIGLADFDSVETSNLQRQILFSEADVGKAKVERAAARLQQSNSGITLRLHDERLSAENAGEIVAEYDLVIDGTDNFATRYLLNDACVLQHKPYIYGSIFRFEGQVSVFAPESGCYRCLFPDPPPPDAVPNCAEGGVLGVLAGIIGTIQAAEALKLVLEIGESLAGRLLMFDALGMRFDEVPLERDENCKLCGTSPTITELRDENFVCASPNGDTDLNLSDLEIGVEELNKNLRDGSKDFLLLDVRMPAEEQLCKIGNSTLIPLHELPERMDEVPRDKDIVVYCRSGARSMQAVMMMKAAGINRAKNLKGGILEWGAKIDQSIKPY